MAEHASHGSSSTSSGGIADHRATYDSFITGAVALSIICAYVLVSLCSFAFAHNWNVFLGFAGLIIGLICTFIDARLGAGRWYLSVGFLVIFGLITAASV